MEFDKILPVICTAAPCMLFISYLLLLNIRRHKEIDQLRAKLETGMKNSAVIHQQIEQNCFKLEQQNGVVRDITPDDEHPPKSLPPQR